MTMLVIVVFVSCLLGALLLWILISENENCTCGECANNRIEFLSTMSRLNPVCQSLILLLLVVIAIPVLVYSMFEVVHDLLA